jgi:hypothetical protein
MGDRYVVLGSGKELVSADKLDSAVSWARQEAKRHPRYTYEVFKLVAEVTAEVSEQHGGAHFGGQESPKFTPKFTPNFDQT